MRGDLRVLVSAVLLSRATMRNIRQNLLFAFLYNALGIPIAAGVLYPVFGILLSPIIASAAMAMSSVSVVGNALRLKQVKLQTSPTKPPATAAPNATAPARPGSNPPRGKCYPPPPSGS